MLKYQYQRAGSTFVPFGSTYNYPFHGYVGKGEVAWTPRSNLLSNVLAGVYLQRYYYRHQDGVGVAGNPWTVDIVTRQVTGPMVNTGSSDEGSHDRAQTTGKPLATIRNPGPSRASTRSSSGISPIRQTGTDAVISTTRTATTSCSSTRSMASPISRIKS